MSNSSNNSIILEAKETFTKKNKRSTASTRKRLAKKTQRKYTIYLNILKNSYNLEKITNEQLQEFFCGQINENTFLAFKYVAYLTSPEDN